MKKKQEQRPEGESAWQASEMLSGWYTQITPVPSTRGTEVCKESMLHYSSNALPTELNFCIFDSGGH